MFYWFIGALNHWGVDSLIHSGIKLLTKFNQSKPIERKHKMFNDSLTIMDNRIKNLENFNEKLNKTMKIVTPAALRQGRNDLRLDNLSERVDILQDTVHSMLCLIRALLLILGLGVVGTAVKLLFF